jgi:CMP-N-acetylneuraminic acid synthetase
MLRLDGDYLAPLEKPHELAASRQSLKQVFKQNGAIYVSATGRTVNENSFVHEPCLPFFMDDKDSVDIDIGADWRMAEFLAGAA